MGLLSSATFAVIVLVFLIQCFAQNHAVSSSGNFQIEQCLRNTNLSSVADTDGRRQKQVSLLQCLSVYNKFLIYKNVTVLHNFVLL